jgi:outer membrane protein assembly factor BamB
MRWFAPVLILCALVGWSPRADASDWPQFRGPSGRASADGHKLPTKIAPDQHVLWKTPLPPGHSSPVVFGDRIYLTAVRDKKLLTLALDRGSGSVLWEAEAPYQKLEKIHAIGSHAQASVVTDGQVVVSYFGSCGLFGYDPTGKQLWHLPMGPFKNDLGAGSSPVLAGDRILLNQDHDIDSFLLAVDKRTGKPLWRTDRSDFPVSYATPVLWKSAGKQQVAVSGSLRVVGYDLETGKEVWRVRGLARAVHMTPTVGADGLLYVAGWTSGGDETGRFNVPTFDALLATNDKNKNGTIELDEMPDGDLKSRYSMIDRDKDGHATREEYDFMKGIFDGAMNRIMAIKPGGTGDVTDTHVLWSQRRYLPVVSSPLLYKNTLFLMRSGGLLATLDATSGTLLKHERVYGTGDYYSSPVGGDGKVYVVSERGDLTVLSAEGQWKVLHRARFGENVYATPALVDGRIYFRTAGHLYCFGE